MSNFVEKCRRKIIEKYKKEEIKKCTGLSDAKIKELEKTLQNA